jgi:hypothetical protein
MCKRKNVNRLLWVCLLSLLLTVAQVHAEKRVNIEALESSGGLYGWQGDVAWYKQDHLFGLVNRQGEVLAAPQFQQVEPFYEGLASVVNNQWKGMVINSSGQVVITPENMKGQVFRFRDGKAIFRDDSTGTYLYGIINAQGEVLIEPEWEDIGDISNDLAVVGKEFRRGLINMQGELIVPCEWEWIRVLENGYWYAIADQRAIALMNPQGQLITDRLWFAVSLSRNGLFFKVCDEENHHGVLDLQGKPLSEIKYHTIDEGLDGGLQLNYWDWEDNCMKRDYLDKHGKLYTYEQWAKKWLEDRGLTLLFAQSDFTIAEKFGFASTSGEVVCPPRWSEVHYLGADYCIVRGYSAQQDDWLFGLVNGQGEVVCEPQWEQAPEYFNDDLVLAYIGDKTYAFVDSRGETVSVLPQGYSVQIEEYENGLTLVKNNEPFTYKRPGMLSETVHMDYKMGYVDAHGQLVIPAIARQMGSLADGLINIQTEGLCGYYNIKGEVVLPLQWTEAYPFERGVAQVRHKNQTDYSYINTQGEVICGYKP